MAATARPGDVAPSSRRSTRFDLPLDLLRIPKSGAAYDLSSGWWPGMPLAEGHPPFHVMTYRSPAGERNQKDMRFLDDNPLNYGFISELMMCTTHTGTHVDALAHITCGPKSTWHGGFSADEFLGDFGPLRNDASQLPPLIRRGVLLDIPKTLGVDHLEPQQSVGVQQLEAACSRKGASLQAGDLVLIRTGAMLRWPEADALAACEGSGLSIEGARWLVARGVTAFAGDNAVLEVAPSGIKGDPQPVHRFLIQEKGLLILEWVYPEELSRDDVSEFLFVCLPLTVRGATGSMVRPIAIV
jgi:kynurenine formamidase